MLNYNIGEMNKYLLPWAMGFESKDTWEEKWLKIHGTYRNKVLQ